jgi:hypothetical protein
MLVSCVLGDFFLVLTISSIMLIKLTPLVSCIFSRALISLAAISLSSVLSSGAVDLGDFPREPLRFRWSGQPTAALVGGG